MNIEEATKQVYGFLQEHKGELMAWDEVRFGSFVCMILEEWCKKNDRDVVEMANEIAMMIKKVNAELGRY